MQRKIWQKYTHLYLLIRYISKKELGACQAIASIWLYSIPHMRAHISNATNRHSRVTRWWQIICTTFCNAVVKISNLLILLSFTAMYHFKSMYIDYNISKSNKDKQCFSIHQWTYRKEENRNKNYFYSFKLLRTFICWNK